MDREALPENPETSVSSPTDQENPVNTKDLLASNVTLDHLLAKEKNVSPVAETDNVHALSEEMQRKGRIGMLAWQIVKRERDRRNAATQRG